VCNPGDLPKGVYVIEPTITNVCDEVFQEVIGNGAPPEAALMESLLDIHAAYEQRVVYDGALIWETRWGLSIGDAEEVLLTVVSHRMHVRGSKVIAVVVEER